jgi:SAM-dependent methyltransferase
MGGDYVAADYSYTALRSYLNPAYQRVCANAEQLPFADECFRFVFSVAVLEHVPRADRAFEQIARVLKPDGIAYVYPAWHCTQYDCDGIRVRPYGELSLRQKWVKATLPVRLQPAVKAMAALPARLARRAASALRPGPLPLHFGRLKPDYRRLWVSDSDAASRLDSHEACLFFQSRGFEVLAPGHGALRQLLARHEPVVVRKGRG